MLLIVNVNIKFYGSEAFITIKYLSIYLSIYKEPSNIFYRPNLMRLYHPVDLTGNLIAIEKIVLSRT